MRNKFFQSVEKRNDKERMEMAGAVQQPMFSVADMQRSMEMLCRQCDNPAMIQLVCQPAVTKTRSAKTVNWQTHRQMGNDQQPDDFFE